MDKNLIYVGHELVNDWQVRVIEKEKDKDKFVYHTIYPFISGWLYGKWTHNPTDIAKEYDEVKKFCKDIWTDEFKDKYKRWRENVGPFIN